MSKWLVNHTLIPAFVSRMITLREKQHAVDPPDIGHGAQPASRDLTIMFVEGGSDLIAHAGEKGTVKGVDGRYVEYQVF